MDLMGEEQLDYGEEDYGGSHKSQFHGSGAIPALADEELVGEDDEYDDLYNDVNVGEGFMQTLHQQRSDPPVPSGNSALQSQKIMAAGITAANPVPSQAVSIPGLGTEQRDPRASGAIPKVQPSSGILPNKGQEEGNRNVSMSSEHGRNMGFQVGALAAAPSKMSTDPSFASRPPSLLPPLSGNSGIESSPLPVNHMGVIGNHPVEHNVTIPVMGSSHMNGPAMLYVGELHWWTTDAELESIASQYGRVKEIKFFDERASGKSKGYCQVEFYDPGAAAACKERMNGYVFNGRPCIVEFANPQTFRQMGSGYMKKNQIQNQSQPQGRGMMNDGNGRGSGVNNQGGDSGRNYGRAGWGRGGQGMPYRGQGGAGAMRGRGATGAKGMAGGTGAVGPGMTAGPYGQGLAGPGIGGPAGALMHPQGMMGAGFDPTFMGRGAAYGGFSAPFPGMMPSFPGVGLPGVAPHVNPAFFGRGMMANGMGMMGGGGMDPHSAGMWGDTVTGWTGEEQGRTRESSYGVDDGASDYGYGETTRDRGGRSNASREKERGSERDWSGNSEKRHHDEREQDWEKSDRDRYREEKDDHRDRRQRGRDYKNEDNWDKGQSSSRSGSKSRMIHDDERNSRTRDGDYGKRRRE